ncbi:uncharacterized protein LOC111640117 [Centruroides sculpturatus]|uniref:uncharacterized protein LOC111640117 n=1 Tax=Centruroides sculpturatus TaxID=218467 RepID=UPI000C6D6886|nr:uncharacterized protein LOC111640117 [Centruroides sculpturatus]
MKIIAFFVVLIGIATVENSKASKNGIRKDVSFAAGNQDKRIVEEVSKQLPSLSGGVLDVIGSTGDGQNGIAPYNFDYTAVRVVADILKNIDVYNFTACIVNELGTNLEKCLRELEELGLYISFILREIDKLLSGKDAREESCSSCGNRQIPGFTPSPNMDYCNFIGNLTDNLECVFHELGKLRCQQYLSDTFKPFVDCLGDFVGSLPRDKTDQTRCLNSFSEINNVLTNIRDGIRGKYCTIGI